MTRQSCSRAGIIAISLQLDRKVRAEEMRIEELQTLACPEWDNELARRVTDQCWPPAYGAIIGHQQNGIAETKWVELPTPADAVACAGTQRDAATRGCVERKDSIVRRRIQDRSAEIAVNAAGTEDSHGHEWRHRTRTPKAEMAGHDRLEPHPGTGSATLHPFSGPEQAVLLGARQPFHDNLWTIGLCAASFSSSWATVSALATMQQPSALNATHAP